MAAAILDRFISPAGSPKLLEGVELVPSGKGVFDVVADGELVFSKHAAGRHAEIDEVLTALAARFK